MGHKNTRRDRVSPRPAGADSGKPCPYVVSVFIIFFLLFPIALISQSDTSYQQGYGQYNRSHFDSAIVSFTGLIAAHPEKKEGYYNRGLCYFRLNNLADARRDFNTCLQMDSVFDDARFMKILILQKQSDWKSAFIEFNKLNTNYAGYKELKKHGQYHNLSVILSRNWYYMIAIMFLFIIFIGMAAKVYAVRKGY